MVNTTILYSAIAVTVVTVGVVAYVYKDEILEEFEDSEDEGGPSACDSVQCATSDTDYFRGNTYQALSAAQKLTDLWTQVTADDTVVAQSWQLDDLFHRDMETSFDLVSDELPVGRPKINHSQGVVSKIEWEDLGGHNYTGLFDGGSTQALMRMSESNFLIPEAGGLAPSLAIKFLRDGMRSVNVLANVGFESTSSFNFFATNFRARLDLHENECAAETIERKFLTVQNRPQSLGISEISRFQTDGSQADDYNFPYDLWFAPHSSVSTLFSDSRETDVGGVEVPFYDQLKTLSNGATVFEVYARDYPEDSDAFPWGSEVLHIANVKLTTAPVTSNFGDSRLFFQHEEMEDTDEAIRPEWASYIPSLISAQQWGNQDGDVADGWPADEVEAEAWVRGSIQEYGCPFAWLLDNTITPIYSS